MLVDKAIVMLVSSSLSKDEKKKKRMNDKCHRPQKMLKRKSICHLL